MSIIRRPLPEEQFGVIWTYFFEERLSVLGSNLLGLPLSERKKIFCYNFLYVAKETSHRESSAGLCPTPLAWEGGGPSPGDLLSKQKLKPGINDGKENFPINRCASAPGCVGWRQPAHLPCGLEVFHRRGHCWRRRFLPLRPVFGRGAECRENNPGLSLRVQILPRA